MQELSCKTIVIVSHYYEPYNLVGAKRATYFANYLEEQGLHTIILKADNDYYGEDICQKVKDHENIISIRPNKFIFIISNSIAWFIAYKVAIEKIMQKKSVNVLFFSGGPFYYFPLGIYFSRKHNVPYLLDFRDPWHRSDVYFKNIKSRIANSFRGICERIAVSRAKLVVNVTKSLTEEYRSKYRSINSDRFVTVFNGYNENSAICSTTQDTYVSNDALNIGIFGKFAYYNISHLKWLFEAVSDLQPILNKKIIIYYLGQEQDILKEAKLYSLDKNIRHLGYVDYSEGLNLLAKLDMLVLNNRYRKNLGTKIFDYIYVNKPIIAITDLNSDISSILNNFNAGFTVNSREELKKAIQTIDNMEQKILDQDDKRWRYSRRTQAEKLLYHIEKFI